MTEETLAPQEPAPDAAPEITAEPAAPSPAPEKVDNVQKRIDQLTWKNHELQRQLEAARKPPEKEPEPLKPPTLEEHGFDEAKYQEAQRAFLKEEARAEAREELKREREREAAAKREQTFKEREESFAKSKPDYRAVVSNPDLPITKEMAQVIEDSEIGPELAYYLGTNEDKAAAIAKLSPFHQARELGRIEAQLESQKAKPPEKAAPISRAPAPPTKLEAVDSTVAVKPDDPDSDKQMSDAEWVRARNKQLSRKRG